MDLVSVVIALVVVGVLLLVVNSIIPLDGNIRKIINVVVILAVVIWLLKAFLPGLVR